MFVQMEELPSMYSLPSLSQSKAPRPFTKTSGSWSGAHQSPIAVNGCQTWRLSAAWSAAVSHLLGGGIDAQELVERGNIFGGSPAPLIFTKDNIPRILQVLGQRPVVIRPALLVEI